MAERCDERAHGKGAHALLQVFKFANQLGILKQICNKALGETWATGERRLPFSRQARLI